MPEQAAALHIVCPHCDRTNRVPSERLHEAPRCGACKAALYEGRPLALTQSTFDRHLQGDLPLLVDFWAAWCGPCRMMAPQFEAAAATLEPRVRLAKLDTKAHPAIATRYGIRSIPTLILFHRGQEIARQPGALQADAIVRWTSALLR